MSRRVWVSAGALTLLLALAAPVAAEEFNGQSAQGKRVQLFTHPNGKVRQFGIRWRTDDCDPGGSMHARWTYFIERLDRSRPGSFKDHGHYVVEYTDATVRFVTTATGHQRENGRWRGTFRIKADIDRPDGPSNTCRLRRIAWSAKPAR